VAPAVNVLWLIDRSTGEVTLLLLTAVVVLGIARAATPRWTPALVEGLHRNLALLTVAFAGAHVAASVADPYAGLRVVDALVPFVSGYRTVWLGLGVLAMYLFAAGLLTSWPVRRLRRGAWTWLHRALYGSWALALVHALATGSDSRNQAYLLLDVVAVAAVLAAFAGLWVAEPSRPRPLRAGLAVLSVAFTIGVAVWAFNGPLQSGWARAAGTPAGLLHSR
jgi:methionine sulfoxide reductase heme-binding subunit